MLKKIHVVLAPLLLLVSPLGHASPAEPSNFDECIIDTMRGVSSDVAARAIIDSCRKLFPDSPGESAPAVEVATPADPAPLDRTGERSLTDDELAQLDARAKVFGASYRVTVQNGNPHLTVTEVTIAVWDDNDRATYTTEQSKAVRIPPQASAEVKYTIRYTGEETGWNWGVVAARGVD